MSFCTLLTPGAGVDTASFDGLHAECLSSRTARPSQIDVSSLLDHDSGRWRRPGNQVSH